MAQVVLWQSSGKPERRSVRISTLPDAPRPRVLLADDHEGLISAWRQLLAPSCDVVGSVRDGRALFEAAIQLEPDVIVVDLTMPGMNGLDACRSIKSSLPRTKVVLVTAGGDEHIARAAFRAGASAFVLKYAAAQDLVVAIQRAMLGETFCRTTPAKMKSH
jgi:DNA-binding NarL/FixJ family response regulator